MASRIKGITVEIGGDTTKLEQSLKSINSMIKSTQSQLKDVTKLLKLDPKNTELLSQKQRLLKDAVQATKEKLEALKEAQIQAKQQLENGDLGQDKYDALQREIVETEEELRRLEQEAQNATSALSKIDEAGKKLEQVGDKMTAAGKKMMPVTAAITGIGTAAVKTTADFDSSMSQVSAISGATGEDLDALRDKAREMGSKTKFSASEAADAMSYMAMAGWKTEDMLDGISGVMDLAAASGEDLATTSDIVTDALTAFGLTAADSGHFADVLAAASSNANTNVAMMTKLSDGKSHYCNYGGIHRTNGYPAGAKIRVVIVPDGMTDTHLAVECFLGLHGNGAARKKDLGSDYSAVQKIVNELAKDEKKFLWAMADYVLNDYAGNGQARIDLLKEYYETVQELVNRAVEAARQICSKDNPYGNGDERIRKLTEAGLDYDVVQGYINRNIDELLKK